MSYIRHELNGSVLSHHDLPKAEDNAEGAGLTIGRAKGNVININDATASGQHAVIELCGDSENYQVRDLNSTNGVFVNGKRIELYTLSVSDVILVGTHEFILVDVLPEDMRKTLEIKKSWIPGVYYTD